MSPSSEQFTVVPRAALLSLFPPSDVAALTPVQAWTTNDGDVRP